MIDSHIHLSYRLFDQMFPYLAYEHGEYMIREQETREQMIREFRENRIECVIEPAIDIESNELLVSLSKKYQDFIYPSVGLHPTRTPQAAWRDRKIIEALVKSENVVAIGECGLDYHYERKEQHRITQKKWFKWQLKLADRYALPLVLHIREADKDAIRILRHNKDKIHGGVAHCFCAGPDVARIYTEELGLCLGIGATLLMNPDISSHLIETVKVTPLKYLLLETDGPYVKPQKPEDISKKKWQKTRNTSLILPAVAQRIAEIKGISIREVEEITTENVKRVFQKLGQGYKNSDFV